MRRARLDSANAAAASSSGDSRERIAARAYELYLQRGGAHGRETEDWLEAEKEIAGRAGRNGASRTLDGRASDRSGPRPLLGRRPD